MWRCDGSPWAAEHALDEVSLAIGRGVVRDEWFASSDRGDDRLDLPAGEHDAERVGVVGCIS